MDSNVSLPTGGDFSRMRFESNNRFQKQRNFFNDSAFFRIHKSKMKSNNKRMNSDGLSAFLQGQTGDGLQMSSIDKLSEEELSYSDLASLTDADLELIGFKYRNERESLLQFFAQLPNQDPTFDELCNQPEAQRYNANIMENASAYLRSMQHALVEANYKLQINVPDDVLVGDKYFASHFLIAALDELNGATDEIENELDELSKVINLKRCKKLGLTSKRWILFAIATGMTAVATFWLMKSNQQ